MVRFLISTTDEMKNKLKDTADKQGQTLCALIRQILWEWVNRTELEAKALDSDSEQGV